ncbi:hypothetical protein [Micromonospora sp. NPDC049301]|uniref:hypothetical protein n=1 Tax=Micromonospora sp. NPDC049301 TaxID=3155723 RepID=UPI003446048A
MSTSPAAAARARIVAVLSTLPGLDDTQALQVLTDVNAHRHVALRQVDAYLSSHPDALTTAPPDAPVGLFRLLRRLEAAGIPVQVPVCASCRQRRSNLPERDAAGQRICLGCAADARRKTCSRCGELNRIAMIDEAGAVCDRCYARDSARYEPCASCGRDRRVDHRRADGSAVWNACHRKPLHRCSDCGTPAPASARTPGGPVCSRCYERNHRPRRQGCCGRCGELGVIQVRGCGGTPDLCQRCSRGERARCAGCGELRFCTGVRTERPLCYQCRPVAVALCARCGHDRRIVIRWPLGPVCRSCYRRARSHPAECARCKQTRVLIGLDAQQRAVCGPCAGAERDYLCRQCGGGEERFRDGRCVRCVTRQRLEEHFSDNDGDVPAALTPVVEALAAARRPRSVLQWLRNPASGARLLQVLIRDGSPIEHATFDALPDRPSVIALRHMLVHLRVLPTRNEHLERLPGWLNRLLATVPNGHRGLVRQYAVWSELRRARRRAARRRFTELSARHTRIKITVAVGLLTWLDHHNLTLDALTQPDIDRWLDDGGSYQIAGFVRWARRQGLIGDLHVPYPQHGEPQITMSDDRRWNLLTRCLQDLTMPVDVRAAGALLLLYGLPLTRLIELRTDQLTEECGRRYLTVQAHRAIMPPALSQILDALPARLPTDALVSTGTPGWLFPGRQAGRPVSAGGMRTRLRRHGIEVRPARNAALIWLAAELPPAVLADVLGISISSAVGWARRAARDWTPYLQARVRVRPSS